MGWVTTGSVLLTVARRISPSASVPIAKYAPRSRKAGAPMTSAKAVASAAPASIATTIGVPRIQSVRSRPMITLSAARSRFDVIRPKLPIAVFSAGNASDSISFCFQKPNVQCCLKAARLHSIPLYSKQGMLHFIVSATSGHALWMILRRCVSIGCANSADFSM